MELEVRALPPEARQKLQGGDGDPCNDTEHDEHVPTWELTYQGTFEDDIPFPQVGEFSYLDGNQLK